MTLKSSRVFTSYAHESDSHNDKVFELSERLRSEGVDSSIDQYEVSPPEGWPRWTRNQIEQANFVLVVCTETYMRRFEGSEATGTGAGAKWEGAIITQQLYDAEGRNAKFIPIVFNRDDIKNIPVEMRGGTYYVLDSGEEYDDLYRHLTDQPKTVKRDLGKLRSLTPKERKESFLGSPNARAPEELVSAAPKPSEPSLPLMVLWRIGANPIFVGAERIRSAGKTVRASIVPSSSRQASGISELERNREPIGLAYNDTAMFAHLKSVEKIIERGQEVWHLELETDEYATRGGMYEYNLSGYSAEQIAEMRARRILLNETLSESIGARPDSLTLQLIEGSVAASYNAGFAVSGSPFPALFEEFNGQPTDFLTACRLNAVLLLLLSNTVSTIERLDISMHSQTELSVQFEGMRPPRYSSGEPEVIKVEGICKLV
jgi:hypothetical protein